MKEKHFMIARTAINRTLIEMEKEAKENPNSPEAVGYKKAARRIRRKFNIPKKEKVNIVR